MEYIEKMDSPTNMRIVISKLPFKIRVRWRGVACEMQERTRLRAKFNDLVCFVDKRAPYIWQFTRAHAIKPQKHLHLGHLADAFIRSDLQ